MLRVELLIVLFRRNVSPDRADRESKNKSDPKRQQTYHDINEKHDERTDQRRVAHADRSEEEPQTRCETDVFGRFYNDGLRLLRVLLLIHNTSPFPLKPCVITISCLSIIENPIDCKWEKEPVHVKILMRAFAIER